MQPVSVLDSLLVALSPGLDYLAVATQDGRLRAFETGSLLFWIKPANCLEPCLLPGMTASVPR